MKSKCHAKFESFVTFGGNTDCGHTRQIESLTYEVWLARVR